MRTERKTTLSNKTYSGALSLHTFEERFEYLALRGTVGNQTFGFERWLNQNFYTSREWRQLRQRIMLRDEGLDLAMPGHEIREKLIVHHIIPMSPDDFEHNNPLMLDPENLICCTHNTHMAIHYGDKSKLLTLPPERRPNDHAPWRQ